MTGWLVARLWHGAGRMQWALAAVLIATTTLATVVVLLISSVPQAFERQEQRIAWTQQPDWNLLADPSTDTSMVYLHTTVDAIGDRPVTVVQVAVVGDGVAAPPGLMDWPVPGQSLVSPALSKLLASTPAVTGRYGQLTGSIGPESLKGPDDLVVVRGITPEQLAPVAFPITALNDQVPPSSSATLALLLALAGIAALVPPLLLAYTASAGLAQAHRRRMANLVIAGAPASLIRRIVVGESLAASILGALLGAAVFLAVRPVLVHLLVVDPAPYPQDLFPSWPVLAIVLLGLPAVMTALGLWTARTVVANPLTSTVTAREGTPPGWLGAVGAALACMAIALGWARTMTGTRATLVLMGLGAAGLALMLPWLCRVVGRWMLTSSRPSLVLGGGWLQSTPWSAARGVLAPCLAIFVSSVFVVTNPTAVGSVATPVIQQAAGTLTVDTRSLPGPRVEGLAAELADLEGVQQTAAVLTGVVQNGQLPVTVWIGDCARIAAAAAMPDLDCDLPGPGWATPEAAAALADSNEPVASLAPAQILPAHAAPDPDDPWSLPLPHTLAPVLTTTPQAVDRPQLVIDPARAGLDVTPFRPTTILVRAPGDTVEQVRNLVAAADPTATLSTPASARLGYDGQLRQYYSLMLWAGVATFATAAAALYATALTGIVRRAPSTAVLGATGTPARTLRTAVTLSIAAPSTLAAVTAMLVGLSAASSLLPKAGPDALTGVTGIWPLLPALIVAIFLGASAALAIPTQPRIRDLPGE